MPRQLRNRRAASPVAPVEPEVSEEDEEQPDVEEEQEELEQQDEQEEEEQEEAEEAVQQDEPEEEQQSVEGAPRKLQFNESLHMRVSKSISASELYRRLKLLHAELSELDQEDADRDGLVPIAQQLAQKALLDHREHGVRAWTALCIVDMFKLLAPDAPFKSAQLKASAVSSHPASLDRRR